MDGEHRALPDVPRPHAAVLIELAIAVIARPESLSAGSSGVGTRAQGFKARGNQGRSNSGGLQVPARIGIGHVAAEHGAGGVVNYRGKPWSGLPGLVNCARNLHLLEVPWIDDHSRCGESHPAAVSVAARPHTGGPRQVGARGRLAPPSSPTSSKTYSRSSSRLLSRRPRRTIAHWPTFRSDFAPSDGLRSGSER